MKTTKSTAIRILGICIIAIIPPSHTSDTGIIPTDILDTLNDGDTEQLKSHTDDFDITAIYDARPEDYNIENWVKNKSNCNVVEIHLMPNAIGMPIEFDGRILSSDKKNLEFIADKKYVTGVFTRNTLEYNASKWTIQTLSMPNKFSTSINYNLLLWNADNNEESFKIEWKQNTTTPTMCISVSYILEDSSKCGLSMKVIGDDQYFSEYSYNFQQTDTLKTIVIKRNNRLVENATYSLSLKIEKKTEIFRTRKADYYYYHRESDQYNYNTVYKTGCRIGIKRIASCADEYENQEIFTIAQTDIQTTSQVPTSFNVYPFGNTQTLIDNKQLSSSCINGGFAYEEKCFCPPGFKGNKCDYACGPNTFGADCSGMCSMHQTQCQQKRLCTNNFGCTCAAGYTGKFCETKCTKGTYGVDCNQKCPDKCNAGACDIYTGTCNDGCKPSYILPNCTEKYQWLIDAPQLLSAAFKSLQLQLNLNPENIHGSKTMRSIYYQIIYKQVLNESEFQYTDLVEIEQQTSAEETIDGLKPGMTYKVGAILISEDGNYNSEDIRIVNYSTPCQLPNSTDYEVNVASGIDYINVTWNKLNSQNENNCKIIEYILKLAYNDTENKQKRNSEKVKTKNNGGYVFENLLSGQRYTVKVAAVSAIGHITTLKTSYISTQSNGLVKIKNINAQLLTNQSSALITWDIDNDTKYEIPYIVKYKVNKYFSCSYKTVESNWTSAVVHNQTKREIWDLTPHTQYIVKVVSATKEYAYNEHENMIYFTTAKSIPKLTPIYNDDNSYVTNHTAWFNWTININECRKLNGFFKGYHIILKNTVAGTQVVKTIKQNSVSFETLEPDTNFELQVYVKTNFGFNSEQALKIPFKTKSKFLTAVKDLAVYRINLKEKSFGIRWSFSGELNNTIDGFILTAIAKDENNNSFTEEMTVKPEKCSAWPTFYCATFKNLKTNIQYKIDVKARSIDYPKGGLSASTVGDFSDGISEKPENLKATYIGSNHIILEWDIPWIFNGVLKSFIVNAEEISSKNSSECCDSKPDVEIQIMEEIPTYNHTIYDLKSGSTYSIGVLPKTSTFGQASRIHVTTTE